MTGTEPVAAEPRTDKARPIVFWLTTIVLPPIALVVGGWLLGQRLDNAGFDALVRHSGVDWSVTIGYFLVLAACATVFVWFAFSNLGRKLSLAILGAVVVAFVMDLVENFLILWSPNPPPLLKWLPGRFWTLAPDAVATVKWCAFVVAIFAFPALVFALVRAALARRSRKHRRRGNTDWWDRVLDVPDPEPLNPDQNDIESSWRRAYYVPDADKLIPKAPLRKPTALCLSGGGIRSGCVAMGAMQTLSRHPEGEEPERWDEAPLLDGFDYIISVSGGGYAAAARLLAVQSNGGGAETGLATRFNPGSPEFACMRRRSSYIADTPLGLVRALAEVLKNLVASLLMVFLIAVIVGWVVGWFVAKLPISALVPSRDGPSTEPGHLLSLDNHFVEAAVAVAIPVGVAVLLGLAALVCELASTKDWSTKWKERLSNAAGAAILVAVLVFVVTWALPGLMWLCAPYSPAAETKGAGIAAFGGLAAVLVLQYGATLVSMLSKKKEDSTDGKPPKWRKLLPPGVVQLGIVVLTLTVLAAAWLLVLGITGAQVFDSVARTNETTLTPVPHWQWILAGILLAVVILSSVDVTSLSLHPFYRGRLARALAVRRINGHAEGYASKEGTWLSTYGRTWKGGPKFVFAAAAALTGDAKPAPGLNAVSYVLSADYIGGPALGWLNTAKLIDESASRIKRDLTVQAAMAISGAAFASAMGRMNKGFQSLLAVSGARLGTWLPNPVFVKNAKDNAANGFYPKALPLVRGAGYFYRELFGINRRDQRLVQVTDGGHYENLGLVEALRRRCQLIYVIDGGGDTPPLLSGLSDAIRLARYELGVEIELDPRGDFGVQQLAPGSARPFGSGHAFHALNNRLTAGAVLRGTIKYPSAAGLGENSTGLLIVAKAVLWRDLPDWVLTYGAGKGGEDFPQDKTSDQWFNEAQFACYTEIGRRIAVLARTVRPHGDHPVPPEDSASDMALAGGDGQGA
ncbi:hypothetical protein [Mycobacterium sp.]|uniref:hypothetical protein n=1 Tax=Mycobacterium sp. TaxID=1785 RepID=UPI002D976E32|nr:hypothetical protein [Mycobacterium sp.]